MLWLCCLEKSKLHSGNGSDSWHIRVQQPMAGEDIQQGIEHVGSAIEAAVDIAETVIASVVEVEVEVDADADSETVFATVVVVEAVNGDDVEAETVNVAGADIVHYVGALVDEGYMEGVDSATAVVLIGPVDDAALVQIHNVHAIVEVREGWQVGVDTCVVEVKEGW